MSELGEASITDAENMMHLQMCKMCMFVWTNAARCVKMLWLIQCTWMYPELDFLGDPSVHETEMKKQLAQL